MVPLPALLSLLVLAIRVIALPGVIDRVCAHIPEHCASTVGPIRSRCRLTRPTALARREYCHKLSCTRGTHQLTPSVPTCHQHTDQTMTIRTLVGCIADWVQRRLHREPITLPRLINASHKRPLTKHRERKGPAAHLASLGGRPMTLSSRLAACAGRNEALCSAFIGNRAR